MAWALVLFAAIHPFGPPAYGQDVDSDPLQVQAKLEPQHLGLGQEGRLKINMNLPDGYHAYSDQFKIRVLAPIGFLTGPLEISPEKTWFDKFSKRDRKGFSGQAELRVSIEAPTQLETGNPEAAKNPDLENRLQIEITYQACTETYCLFPKTKNFELPWRENLRPSIKEKTFAFDVSNFEQALEQSLWLSLILAYFFGLLTSLTPCIFPMIPITLAILGNHAEKRSRRQNFLISLVYVHGIAFTYSLLGLAAARTGGIFGSLLGNTWVLAVLCALMLAMALGLFGVFDLQMPASIRNKFGRGRNSVGYGGAFLSGLGAGVLASPCVGPVLVSLLAFVSTQQNAFLGFILLFTYAMGLGTIFLVLGAFSELQNRLPKSGPWMDVIKWVLGLFMLGGFYYYLKLALRSDFTWSLLLSAGLLSLSIYFLFFRQGFLKGIRLKVAQAFWGSILVFSISYGLQKTLVHRLTQDFEVRSSSLRWNSWSPHSLTEARSLNKPVLIDFWAEWCLECHELADVTFRDPEVERKLKDYFYLVKFDATKDSQELQELKAKYNIKGLPTLIWHDAQGNWIKKESLFGFENPKAFNQRIDRVLSTQH